MYLIDVKSLIVGFVNQLDSNLIKDYTGLETKSNLTYKAHRLYLANINGDVIQSIYLFAL